MENKDKLCKICKKNKRGFLGVQTCSECRRKKNQEEEETHTKRNLENNIKRYQNLTEEQKKEILDRYRIYQRIYHKEYYHKKKGENA